MSIWIHKGTGREYRIVTHALHWGRSAGPVEVICCQDTGVTYVVDLDAFECDFLEVSEEPACEAATREACAAAGRIP